jgi:hypothetical protein
MTVLIPRHSGQSATVREGLTGKRLPTISDTHWAAKRRLREHLSGSSTKVLSSVSPREDPNEGSYPRVRQSIEPVASSSIDVLFGLVFVLLRELLLQARQRISARLQYVLAPRTQDSSLSLATFGQDKRGT